VLDFKAAQMFESSTNYTCILHLKSSSQNSYQYTSFGSNPSKETFIAYINDARIDHQTIEEFTDNTSKLTEGYWYFIPPDKRPVFSKMERMGVTLEGLTDDIFVGLQTSADPIYILEKTKQGYYYSKYLEAHVALEDEFMRPLLRGGEIQRYKVDFQNQCIIFPYHINGNRASLIPANELQQNYPFVWDYLCRCEEKLRGREQGKMDHEGWYGFGRTQNIAAFGQSKIMTQVLARGAAMVPDREGMYRFVGGGNAGGYGIVLRQDAGISYECLVALLNSKLLETYLQYHSSLFRGGYYSYSKRYLKELPIVIPNEELQAYLAARVNSILTKKTQDRDTTAEEQEIDRLVYQLYRLTYDEVLVIDPEPPFSREAYNNNN
jgi:hypothetical protein